MPHAQAVAALPLAGMILVHTEEIAMQTTFRRWSVLFSLLMTFVVVRPAAAQSEIPPDFSPVTEEFDHVRREVKIPMRDGVKL
ncbi:MAG TPA: hypothetical protein VE010_05055, partial [Thermoanaerobaculia bacterium]|nr:hypothetical protein [Thermoanaerobaculia bacterium]